MRERDVFENWISGGAREGNQGPSEHRNLRSEERRPPH